MKKSPKPFTGTHIYYSGSIAGMTELDVDFPQQLIEYMQENGAHILDPHVAIPHKGDEYLLALATTHGFTPEEWLRLETHEKDLRIYKHDIALVDQATHVITVLNGVSHGVGMEIQEALRKPFIGLNHTPILGLIHESKLAGLSAMIRGAATVHEHFLLRSYTNLTQAIKEIHTFLTK